MDSIPVKSPKVYEVIFNQIKESFISGELKPGDKLPPERELSNLFKVSRTSIREALRVLEINGVIEIRPGDGTFIRQSDVQSLIEQLSTSIIKTEDNMVYEMLEVRRVIETECAFLAAQRANSLDLQNILKALEEMARSEHDEELGLRADLLFHHSIAQATNNSIYAGLVHTLSDQMKNTIRATRWHRFAKPGHFQETLQEHKEIYYSIALKDADKAKQLMNAHIIRIREQMAAATLESIGEDAKIAAYSNKKDQPHNAVGEK
ncbi:FadR/GntR family transcriptional regulator [Peribacillus frigoritolerans]|uniref:FadR/GntR family transcriptional regulator n=1 Tax=Peribacillus frigoritolerans TaxID=450367 RepID=UPI003CFE067E